jgi:protocatechuate 3,4-dioxygenase beta subunit
VSLLALALTVAACSAGGTSGAGSAAGSPATTPTATTTEAAPTTTAPPRPSATDLLGAPAPCQPTPATIAGPTWFDAHVVRRDVREGKPGVELDLALRVVRSAGCAPVAGAVVDLWQADANGVYSGFAGSGSGDGGAPDGQDQYGKPQSRATDPGRALRGTQSTGPDGVVQFTTIYPGWYPTRTPHLHVEVHVGGRTVLTTQLFFDDAVSDRVFAANPAYQQHGQRDTRNGSDHFYSPAAQLRLAADGPRWLGATQLGLP